MLGTRVLPLPPQVLRSGAAVEQAWRDHLCQLVFGALFNACAANYTRSTEEPESDPDEGPIIPLGGAVTGLTRG
jgi:hypothetical protein